MSIRDTSSFPGGDPPQPGDKITPGVAKELIKLGMYPIVLGCEVYALPGTIGASLTYLTLRATAIIIGVKPSDVDLEVMAASAFTGLPIRSRDGDIHTTMAAYLLQLPQRMVYSALIQQYLLQASILSDKYIPIIEKITKIWGGP